MTIPGITSSANSFFSSTSSYSLDDAWSRRNWSLMRQIVKANPEALYKRDSDSKTLFHCVIDAQDLKAFEVLSDYIDCSKMGPEEGVLERLSINDYIVVYGNIEMLELFVKNKKYHHDHLFFYAVKYHKKEHLEWLAKNVPFETGDYCAFDRACFNLDPETAFFIMDLFPPGHFKQESIYPNILARVIQQKSLPFIKAMLERIELESGKKDYSYFSQNEFLVYVTALFTWDMEIVEFFMSLTGVEIFKAKREEIFIAKEWIKKNKLNFLETLLKKYPNLKEDLKKELEELLYVSILLDDIDALRTLIDWGVDFNAIMHYEKQTYPIIYAAIFWKNARCISVLIEKKVKVWDENEPLYDILIHAIKRGLDELVKYIVDQETVTDYPYHAEIHMATHYKSKILDRLYEKNFINVYGMTQKEAKESIASLSTFTKDVNKTIVFDFYKNCMIMKNSNFYHVERYRADFLNFIEGMKKVYALEDVEDFVDLIFGYGFKIVRPFFFSIPNLFIQLEEDLRLLPSENLKIYLLALQAYKPEIFNDFSILKRVALQKLPFPARSSLLNLSEEQCKGWLEYGALLRSRKTSSLNFLLLKQKQLSNDLLKILLQGLSALGIPHLNKSGKQWIFIRLVDILKQTSVEDIKIEAIKALWLIDKNRNNRFIKEQLLDELEACTSEKSLAVLIEVLSNYEDQPDFKIATKLLQIYRADISYHLQKIIALALRKIPHKEGLLTALKIVQSPVWSPEDKYFAVHHEVKKGDVFQMFNVPEGWHTNRLAIVENILDQLVEIYFGIPSFQAKLTKVLEQYKNSDVGFEAVRAFQQCYKKSNRQTLGAPIFFPKDSNLARVLGTRKGKELYLKAIVDLFLHGCFDCDLSEHGVEVTTATWSKNGIIYSTSDLKLFYRSNTNAYRTDDFLMIIFSADKFNQAQRVGQSRIEEEHTLNPVFYEGISKAEIECIYMHEKLKHDIDSLASDRALDGVKTEFNGGVFDKLSLKELKQLRRHLLIKEEHHGKFRSLHEKIAYYSDDAPLTKEKVESEFEFASREEVYEESLKRLLGREILADYLGLPSNTFMCQRNS